MRSQRCRRCESAHTQRRVGPLDSLGLAMYKDSSSVLILRERVQVERAKGVLVRNNIQVRARGLLLVSAALCSSVPHRSHTTSLVLNWAVYCSTMAQHSRTGPSKMSPVSPAWPCTGRCCWASLNNQSSCRTRITSVSSHRRIGEQSLHDQTTTAGWPQADRIGKQWHTHVYGRRQSQHSDFRSRQSGVRSSRFAFCHLRRSTVGR